LIAEDRAIMREGLRKMVESDPNLKVVGEARDGREAVALAMELHPQVVLMDIALPLINGVAATREVLKALPDTKVLILSGHDYDAYVKGPAESDIVGFLLNQTSARDVCRAIEEVQKGKRLFRSSTARRMDRADPHSPRRAGRAKQRAAHLTSREMEVLQRIAEGKANKEIAVDLGIGIKTVEKHRQHVMEKLDIHETAGLTRFAIAAGIIDNGLQWRMV
jgi:DNA-binding NarL/FixJ family response regulator